jgi:hypothetical protein
MGARKGGQQRVRSGQITGRSGRQPKAGRETEGLDGGMDVGAQPAPACVPSLGPHPLWGSARTVLMSAHAPWGCRSSRSRGPLPGPRAETPSPRPRSPPSGGTGYGPLSRDRTARATRAREGPPASATARLPPIRGYGGRSPRQSPPGPAVSSRCAPRVRPARPNDGSSASPRQQQRTAPPFSRFQPKGFLIEDRP